MRNELKKRHLERCRFGGGGWIRTTEANATDLQSAPFGHSGTPPYEIVELVDGFEPPTC